MRLICALFLDSCGLTETGAAAAGGAASQAQQAQQGRKAQEDIKRKIEDANQQAADRQGAAAEEAAR